MGSDGLTLSVLEARHFSKSFGGERALADVSLSVLPGEVHGLLGENGSGKSTLIKILAGYHAPDPGAELEVNGRRVDLPLAAGRFRALGMSFVHQDLGLIPFLSVAENLQLTDIATAQWCRISRRAARRRAREALGRVCLEVEPHVRVEELEPAKRALLAIARALATPLGDGQGVRGLLVLDEPTVFLHESERQRLFGLVREAAGAAWGVLFVSHDLEEARAITDRITVLRDGRNAGTIRTATAKAGELVELIAGRSLTRRPSEPRLHTSEPHDVRVRDLWGSIVRGVSLELSKGEILGITGLGGSGYEEVLHMIYGARGCRRGELLLEGAWLDLRAMTPTRALRTGMAFVPADRQRDGGIEQLSVADNVTMPTLERYRDRFRLRRRLMLDDAKALLERYGVRPSDPRMEYRTLSGGNQQKALLAKWLQMGTPLLLLDQPIHGVDVTARHDIPAMIRDVARSGAAVICASADNEELALLCDRVLVFSEGKVAQELAPGELAKEFAN